MAEIYSIDGIVPVIDPSAYVHPTAVIIGDVFIGANVYVAPCASLRGDMGRIIVGDNSNVQDGVVVHGFPDTDTVIEEFGHIGHCAVIHGCTLRRNVLVGMNSVIMDAVEVGESSFIAASAFIPAKRKIPPKSVVVGVPGTVVRGVTQQELDWKRGLTQGYIDLCHRTRETLKRCEPLSAAEPNRARFKLPPSVPLSDAKGR
jgi:phenylacetic acid degradation protein